MGCKRSTLALTIPSIIFWLLIYFGHNFYFILLANFCGGLVSGGSAATIMLYISEIANDKYESIAKIFERNVINIHFFSIRGRLGSLQLFVRNIGILLAYILGATIDYKYIPSMCVVIPIIFAIAFAILPNTPQFYLQREKTQVRNDRFISNSIQSCCLD